jgi:putative peptide zinc metalloprotease protein
METLGHDAFDGAPDRLGGRAPVEGAEAPEAPARAEGLELFGEHASSGHRRPPSLARRADGQTVQLTPLLYRVLEAIDGRSRYPEIAEVVSRSIGKTATPDQIRFLVEEKLGPLGLIAASGGGVSAGPTANPLLALRGRLRVVDAHRSRRLAGMFTWLFRPVVVLAVVVAATLTIGWVLFENGLAGPARHALYDPKLLLLIFGLTIVSAAFHEIGHAAACLYGGAKPGAMGAGLYILWPAFYTDVTDAYRLDRRSRLRVDLGGIYFNGVFAVVALLLWWLTRWEAVLLVVPIQLLQTLRQLPPLIRLDGYHILADLTGVPDLYSHIKPVLVGMLPSRWGRPESRVLRPWARAVVSIWVVIVVPVLLGSLAMMAVAFPRLVATAWDSLGIQFAALRQAFASADLADMGVRALSILALALPVLAVPYLLSRVVGRATRSVWRATDGRPAQRAVAILVAAGILAALTVTWWPDGQYQPIDRNDRGVLQDGFKGADLSLLPPMLASSDAGSVTPAASLPVGQGHGVSPEHTAHGPGASSTAAASTGGVFDQVVKEKAKADGGPTTTEPSWRPPWGVQFNPPEPGEGDNFAIAVNTEDFTSMLDVAFSIVFADGDTIDHSNRAYALANCMGCVAVAIAFQVVLITAAADLIIPDNLAVAMTASCVSCLTYALAIQLVVTLSGPLSDAAMEQLDALWSELEALEEQLGTTIPIAETAARLDAIEAAILRVLVDDGVVALLAPADPMEDASASPDGTSRTTTSTTSVPASTEPTTTRNSETTTTTPETTSTPTTAPTSASVPEGSTTTTVEPAPTATSEPESPATPDPTSTDEVGP